MKKEKSLKHISWFSLKELRGKEIIKMCRFCGNTDMRKKECPDCDIAFERYILA